ncbi:protein late bloomer [Drosophila miranda]|uniref:Tetraspanin n=1 Tax=Drosophila pseudoobscura pseudoobscura TaxID=46245 RepID=A0A6I8USE0_DROPS|nr:protein late bloomer [Drosophila pseudoobscura]XP_017150593.1 protein late bloomer [Drosophila miranda]
MGCATGTIKYSLFLFNALWAILGILVLIFGGLGWGAMPDQYAIGILVLGGIILLISLFGCCGAVRESPRMLWTYVSLLVVLLVLIAAFIVLNPRDVFKKYALQTVEDHWQLEQTQPGSMDLIQKTYSCCGRNSAQDYLEISYWNASVPNSCCKDNNCVNPLNLYAVGCISKVEEAFSDEATTSRYLEWGLLGFDVVILSLAIILAIHYTNRRRRYNY